MVTRAAHGPWCIYMIQNMEYSLNIGLHLHILTLKRLCKPLPCLHTFTNLFHVCKPLQSFANVCKHLQTKLTAWHLCINAKVYKPQETFANHPVCKWLLRFANLCKPFRILCLHGSAKVCKPTRCKYLLTLTNLCTTYVILCLHGFANLCWGLQTSSKIHIYWPLHTSTNHNFKYVCKPL